MSTEHTMQTPIGPVGIFVSDGRLCGVDLRPDKTRHPSSDDPLVQRVISQLDDYFMDGKSKFSLPLSLSRTGFQQRVWQALCRIGPGEIRTYGDLARELKTSPRAVGNACRRNPVPIVVPCHRVVSVQGIGGYSGATSGARLEIKRWLLSHEGVIL